MITVELRRLNRPGAKRILDIGCGSGRHTAAACGLDQALVVGADRCTHDLQQARQRLEFHAGFKAIGPGSRWGLMAADIEELPFADGCFDVVICSEVLEHLHSSHRALREITRVLAPHGRLALSVPRGWPEAVCWAFSRAYRTTPGGHVRIVHPDCLVAALADLGLRCERKHHAHSLHSPYWWLKCLLGIERDQLAPVRWYNRLLTWDIMKRPRLTRCLDRLLNPLLGKSVVLYFSRC